MYENGKWQTILAKACRYLPESLGNQFVKVWQTFRKGLAKG